MYVFLRRGAVAAKLGVLGVALIACTASASNPVEKRVFFGDFHLHTRYSNDAFYLTTEEGLDEAYRYAKGEEVDRRYGTPVRLNTSLDFLAVTEHAEFLGALQSFTDPDHPLYHHPELGRLLRSPESDERMKAWFAFVNAMRDSDELEGYDEKTLKNTVWDAIVAAADRHYEPGQFTTFAAYEWTSYVDGGNLHRNIIYKDTKNLPLPFTAQDSSKPEDLWTFLERQRAQGREAIAIPHNSNISDGRMFALVDSDGDPVGAAHAARRTLNEPLVEITQNKGTSETHPELSPEDPFAGFEIFSNLLAGNYDRVGKIEGSYVRDALLNGVNQHDLEGFNPFMFGFVGATDSHSAFSIVEENNATGWGGSSYDGDAHSRWKRPYLWNGLPFWALSASGLTGVWAEENTRESLFEALRRRETYATTGPQIRARVLATWQTRDTQTDDADNTVPMGGVLKGFAGAGAPRFSVWAAKDPSGANLDRIQIIKGWSRDGTPHVKIFDVALSDGREAIEDIAPDVGNTVNVAEASYTNSIGEAELDGTWTDPDFDPSSPAFYYMRVIEIPTPRWSTYDAEVLGIELPDGAPPSIQERAFTSPIWYVPDR